MLTTAAERCTALANKKTFCQQQADKIRSTSSNGSSGTDANTVCREEREKCFLDAARALQNDRDDASFLLQRAARCGWLARLEKQVETKTFYQQLAVQLCETASSVMQQPCTVESAVQSYRKAAQYMYTGGYDKEEVAVMNYISELSTAAGELKEELHCRFLEQDGVLMESNEELKRRVRSTERAAQRY